MDIKKAHDILELLYECSVTGHDIDDEIFPFYYGMHGVKILPEDALIITNWLNIIKAGSDLIEGFSAIIAANINEGFTEIIFNNKEMSFKKNNKDNDNG